jgi:hypothetical protein
MSPCKVVMTASRQRYSIEGLLLDDLVDEGEWGMKRVAEDAEAPPPELADDMNCDEPGVGDDDDDDDDDDDVAEDDDDDDKD